MAKKGDMSNIMNIGTGILDTLREIKEEDNKVSEEIKSNNFNIQNEEITLDQNNKNISTEKSKRVKEEKYKDIKVTKSKRSFMLTENTIQKLNLLKLCMSDADLSQIVEESIIMYFNNNKKSIEELISLYENIK